MLLKKKKIPKYITDEETSGEKHFDEENYSEE